MNGVFTTTEIARLVGVAPQTVCKWIDTGRLKGYRVPFSNHRRVSRANLIRFLRENKLPMGALEFTEAVPA
jgi:excisionase family DNA binding protein